MRSPFKIAPWSPCPSFYFDIADRVDVGRQRFARKSQLREIYLGFMAIQFAHASSAWGRRVRIQTDASASRAHDALSPAIYLGVVRRDQDRRFYQVPRKLGGDASKCNEVRPIFSHLEAGSGDKFFEHVAGDFIGTVP